MKNLLIYTLALTGVAHSASAQRKSEGETKGDKYYNVYAYDKAISSYTFTKTLTPGGSQKLASSYHKLNKNTESEAVYAKMMNEPTGIMPEDYFDYAMVLKANGKYDEAAKWMDKFSSLKPDDLRAKDYAAHKNDLAMMLKDNGRYKISPLKVNSPAEDFGTSFYRDKIVFASTRGNGRMFERKDNWNRKPYLDLYVSDIESGQLKAPVKFDKEIHTKFHNGPASFSNGGTVMAITCNNHGEKVKTKIIQLQICFSTLKDGKWSDHSAFTEKMPYSTGQPCLSEDGNTMYFTSDMPGGFGKADIYKVTKDGKGNWGKAENLGDKINTEGDELFPFYDEAGKMLYFSSNGRFGLGGQDVFTAAADGAGFSAATNAGAPLNTSSDDFAAIVNSAGNGYVSSNRAGGSGSDDIYSFNVTKAPERAKKIEGLAMDKDRMPLAATRVSLMDDKGNVLNAITTQNDGAYVFIADKDKNFKLSGTKEHYKESDNVLNTFTKDSIIKSDLMLMAEEPVKAPEQVLELNPNKIYFDVNKSNIRPDAAQELNRIAKVMNDHPGMRVELGSYADCRASMKYNQVLSDKRATASAAYIKKRITNPERISGKGYGETHLVNGCACEGKVVSTCSDEEHQQNRRTEFRIIK